MSKLTNKYTGFVIEKNNIISKTENGVVSKDKNCWKYIPEKYLKEEKELLEIKRESIPLKKNTDRVGEFFVENGKAENSVEKRRAYAIVTDISFERRIYEKNSAFISKPIDVSNCAYIEIGADRDIKYSDLLEISILDGIDEYPILPISNSSKIDVVEKLFFMMDTRFPIDHSNIYSVYKGTEDVGQIDISSITQDMFEENNYYIKYTPANTDYYEKYKPKNNTIKVKAVLRSENTLEEKQGVQAIRLFRFGGAPQWT